jgi:hypothetical protein
VITGFQLELNGRYRDGSIEEKWKARTAYNTIVCVQRSCLCDESRSLDGRSGATFTIKPVVCCVALRSRVVNDAAGASVRAERIVKRLRGLDNC